MTPTVSATFLFADIAGFTALTEAHGDEEAAEIVAAFGDAVRRELPASGGTQVKTIGDALMLSLPDPAPAVLLGLRITQELMLGHGAPAVRVGLHHGPAVERSGDYFGAAVNLAARVSAEAAGGEVLLTASTGALAPRIEGVVYEPRGRRQLRNVREPVELLRAVRVGQRGVGVLPYDPVCRMAVDPDRSAGRLVHDGRPTSSARSPAQGSSRAGRSASRADTLCGRRPHDERSGRQPSTTASMVTAPRALATETRWCPSRTA
jgi:class 3 adenylate cyclase